MKIFYLLLISLCVFSNSSKGQTIDFTFTTSNGLFCAPQIVTFTSTATGSPSGYLWDFGDGLAGSNNIENHLYDFPGTYSVTLTVLYSNSALTVTKSVTINPMPTVTLSANRTSLCQPGNVNFSAAVTGSVTSYEWNFGDATPLQTTATNTISHSFSGYGTYNVTVKVTSSAGCTAINNVTIQIARIPISGNVNPSNGCLPVNATLSLSTVFPPGDALQNVLWNFGDGTPNTNTASLNIVHTYNTTNPIINANVLITSVQGCTNVFTFPRFAYGIPPTNTVANTVALRDTFCGSETIDFYGYADSANLYRWDFGDGTNDTTSTTTISHKYQQLGNIVVVVTPFYNGCAGQTRTLNIYITGVIANYTYANTCSNKSTFNFTNTSLGPISSYEWSYSDMPGFNETTNYNPTHTFPTYASSIVKLLVVDNVTGCRDSLISTIYTAVPNVISDKSLVCKDSSIQYQVLNTYPAGSGHNYEFNIAGNVIPVGGSSTYSIIPRLFGMYNDYVVISDALPGTCNDTLYLPQPTKVAGPVVDFTVPALLCQDTGVVFQNNSYPFFPSDNITKWFWNFGDGKKDSVQNPPPHLYASPGQINIVLEATDINGCKQRLNKAIVVGGLPNIVVFPAIDTVCTGQTVMLAAYTIDSLIWQSHPDISCTSCDTVFVTPGATTYYIATALSPNGCRRNDTTLVKVYGPINLVATPSQTTVCAGTAVQFSLNATGITTWSPSTFLNSTTIPNPVSVPDTNITYTIIVKDSVGCYADTTTAIINVFPKTTVDAGPDQILPYNTSFTLSPVYSAGTQIYAWSPAGNLNCTDCPSPMGTALTRQQYFIDITDINNCKARDSVNIFVNCEKSNLLLPTAFTPNGDGKNDILYPITRGYRSIKSFVIFNRNGSKVFEKKNFQPNIAAEGWDGKIGSSQGENTQSFVWIIEGICDTGMSIFTKGSVILMR
ncbi:MAG: PKD domain-containing protein [Ferruginibacter sp.]